VIQKQLKDVVREVIEHLVSRRYAELEAMTNGVRLKASDIDRAVAEYGRDLVPPPENAYELLDIVEVRGFSNTKWSVVIPLWTREEGRSDLSVELTLIRCGEKFAVEFDNIHVL
jgi:hypothetical protein